MLLHRVLFLVVHGREVKLEDPMILIDGVAFFGLESADDPIAAFFSFREGVQTTCRHN